MIVVFVPASMCLPLMFIINKPAIQPLCPVYAVRHKPPMIKLNQIEHL